MILQKKKQFIIKKTNYPKTRKKKPDTIKSKSSYDYGLSIVTNSLTKPIETARK